MTPFPGRSIDKRIFSGKTQKMHLFSPKRVRARWGLGIRVTGVTRKEAKEAAAISSKQKGRDPCVEAAPSFVSVCDFPLVPHLDPFGPAIESFLISWTSCFIAIP